MNSNSWQIPSQFPSLHFNEVHIWHIDVKNFIPNIDELWQLLGEAEQQRAQKFIFNEHRNNFIVVHGLLRQLLSKYLQKPVMELLFVNSSCGKPEVIQQGSETMVNFNISHSGQLALLAFAKNIDVGVDIEIMNEDVTKDDIAKRFFSKKEVEQLLAIDSNRQVRAFFNCWVRKEAFIKLIGQGLFFPLDQFDVNMASDEQPLLLDIYDKYKIADWLLYPLNLPNDYKDYVGAVATPSCVTEKNIKTFILHKLLTLTD